MRRLHLFLITIMAALAVHANDVYLKNLTIRATDDGQGYILTDKQGNERTANFDITGVAAPYNLEAPEEIAGDDPIVITPNQVGPSTCGHEVILRQVLAYTGRISNFDGETCEGYITYDPILPMVLTWGYDIKGVVEEYEYWEILYQRTGYRLRVDNIIGLHSGHNDIADIKRIKGLYNMRPPKGDDIYFFLSGHFVEPLTVVYENGGLLYVRDSYGDYALVEGFFQGTFTNGDLIYDAIAYPDYYYAEYNPIFPTEISSFTPGGHHDAVEPDVFSINDLGTDLLHYYVRINAVTLTDADDQGRQFIVDDTGTLQLLDRFSTGIPQDSNNGNDKLPEDLNGDSMVNVSDINILINTILTGTAAKTATTAGTLYDVIGFLGIRNGQLVFYPTEIIYHENMETQAGDLNDDGRVNISDINCLIHYILNH